MLRGLFLTEAPKKAKLNTEINEPMEDDAEIKKDKPVKKPLKPDPNKKLNAKPDDTLGSMKDDEDTGDDKPDAKKQYPYDDPEDAKDDSKDSDSLDSGDDSDPTSADGKSDPSLTGGDDTGTGDDGMDDSGMGDSSMDGSGDDDSLGGDGTDLGEPKDEYEDKKKFILFQNYSDMLNIAEELRTSISLAIVRLETDSERKMYETLVRRLDDMKEKLLFTMNNTFETSDYEKLLTIFLYIKTNLVTISEIMEKVTKE
jgi:hypothetical protein